MRFAKALVAAAMCWAGQAQAIPTFNLSTTLTPQNSSWYFSTYQIGPETQTITFRASSPVTGLVSVLFDLTAVKYVNGHFQHYTDFILPYEAALNGQRSVSFQAGCPRGNQSPGYSSSYSCSHWSPPDVWVSLSGISEPVTVTLSGWSPTPEPSTWALMILGFGAVGAAVRKQRKRGSSSALSI